MWQMPVMSLHNSSDQCAQGLLGRLCAEIEVISPALAEPAGREAGLQRLQALDLGASLLPRPQQVQLQKALARAYARAGEDLQASAAELAALGLEQGDALLLFNLATGCLHLGQLAQAKRWFLACLALDPQLARAHLNLAAVLRESGYPAEAAQHLHAAYALQWIYPEPIANPVATVLVLCAPGVGNIPIQDLLPVERFSLIKCYVHGGLAEAQLAQPLPAHELVLNAIGDADNVAADDRRLQSLLARSDKPLLNAPGQVLQTRRDLLPARLHGLQDVLVPEVQRIELSGAGSLALAHALREAALPYPLIIRPVATHGGCDVLLARDESALQTSRLGEEALLFATRFYDYRSADGFFRKYRIIFIQGEPYPYHLAISSDWLVHYFSADMQAHDWKLEEERRFLQDPQQALGPRAMQAVRAIGQRLELDYVGMDFSVLADGRVLVFEANPTMLVHAERVSGPLAYKNPYIQTIIQAFEQMLLARIKLASARNH